jgi:hypothetical protein
MARLLTTDGRRAPRLRELLDAGEMVLAPGCYDALGCGRAAQRPGRPGQGVLGDRVIGAIGVSGAHYSQDMEVAQAGLA